MKGTRLLADDLVAEMEQARTDDDLFHAHPELTPPDVAAVREYAKVPTGLRRLAGAWADEAEELDQYLKWNRRQKPASRRPMWEMDG